MSLTVHKVLVNGSKNFHTGVQEMFGKMITSLITNYILLKEYSVSWEFYIIHTDNKQRTPGRLLLSPRLIPTVDRVLFCSLYDHAHTHRHTCARTGLS